MYCTFLQFSALTCTTLLINYYISKQHYLSDRLMTVTPKPQYLCTSLRRLILHEIPLCCHPRENLKSYKMKVE